MTWLLKLIPIETVMWWLARQLTGLDDRYIDLIVRKVEDYDRENLPGYEKRQRVYDEVRKALDDVADWAINLIIELAVARLRKKLK